MAVEALRSLAESLLNPLFSSLYFKVSSAGVARALQVYLVQLGHFQQSLANSGWNRGTVALKIKSMFDGLKSSKWKEFCSCI